MEIKTIQFSDTQWQYELWKGDRYIGTDGVNRRTEREAFDAGVRHREELHPDPLFFGAGAGSFVIRDKTYEEAVTEAIAIEIASSNNSIPELYCNGEAILPVYSNKENDLIAHMALCEYRGQTIRTRKRGEIYEFGILGYPYCKRLEDCFLYIPFSSYWSEAGYKFITFDLSGSVKLHKETPQFKNDNWISTAMLWILHEAEDNENSVPNPETRLYSLEDYTHSLDLTRFTRIVQRQTLKSKFQYGDLVFAKEGHNKGKYFTVSHMMASKLGIVVIHENNLSLESDLILIASRQELQTRKQNSLRKD